MSLSYAIYIDGVFQGTSSSTSWSLNNGIYTTPPTPFGQGYYLPLPYSSVHTWRIDTTDSETELTTTGDTWVFTVQVLPALVPVPERPSLPSNVVYQPGDTQWDWVPAAYDYGWLVKGGGRYQKRLICFSYDNDGLGKIFVGEI